MKIGCEQFASQPSLIGIRNLSAVRRTAFFFYPFVRDDPHLQDAIAVGEAYIHQVLVEPHVDCVVRRKHRRQIVSGGFVAADV